MKLVVCSVPSGSYALQNVLVHNITDFDGKRTIYLRINNVIYKSVAGNISLRAIGLNSYQRSSNRLIINDIINVDVHQINKEKISNKISFSIKSHIKLSSPIFIAEKELCSNIRITFREHYFCEGQVLILKIARNRYILTVTHCDRGFCNKQTDLSIISSDISLNIYSHSNAVNRDIFKDDFNFESIGIGGLKDELIDIFRRGLSSRCIKSNIIKRMGTKHVKGILLYGPPGTGKTLIARNISKMLNCVTPKVVNGPEVLNSYIGNSEKNVRELFSDAIQEYKQKGDVSDLHVIIFDEIDAICRTRSSSVSGASRVTDSIVNQLLSMIDGPNELNNIFIIGMTNRKDLIDPALLRAGRLELHIKIGLPNIEGRKEIFNIHTKNLHGMIDKDVDMDKLVKITENFSGAEIESVVKNAVSLALYELLSSDKKDINESDIIITKKYFEKAIQEISPSFGSMTSNINDMIPENIILYEGSQKIYEDIITSYNDMKTHMISIIIYGDNKSGKTTLICKVAKDLGIKFTKIISAMDIIEMDEITRSQYIIKIIKDSYLVDNSMVILDDIDNIINFVSIGNVISFSNKLYQTISTILKSTQESNKLIIICTTGNMLLYENICKLFDRKCII